VLTIIDEEFKEVTDALLGATSNARCSP